jgi:kinesin family protein C2/C3
MAATDMNEHSSRSHMLSVVDVRGFNVPANIEYLGKLYLVDLAGSERVAKSGAQGQNLKEAQAINQSLSALGNVMQALQKQAKHIPYRDSTLTDLMANALGGNAKTVMFINLRPTSDDTSETISSLNFAQRVGKVELGQAKKNVKGGGGAEKGEKKEKKEKKEK